MKIKIILAKILDKLKISYILFMIILRRKKGQNIRILNYHNTFHKNKEIFSEQLDFYRKYFEILDYLKLKEFLEGKYLLKKPGLLITFDDGLEGNYFTAKKILEPLGIGAIFFVSADKIDEKGYMSVEQIKEILKNKRFSIGSHTSTHRRMNINDTDLILDYEIVRSKNKIEKIFDIKIDSFCWCGGELETYTRKAYVKIINSYKYIFTTNNKLIYSDENKFFLERTNIEDFWDKSLVLFQLCGILDLKYYKKRNIVRKRLIKL